MSLKKYTTYNVLGAGMPVFVSLVTIPLYLKIIGDERFGVLAIVWLLLGYFGVFDLGLSRATTNYIARLKDASIEDREKVFWTALTLNIFMGVLGGAILYLLAKPLLIYAFKMPINLQIEVLNSLPFIALAVPVATVSGVFSGALGAREHFGIMNIIQSFGTLLFQVSPLIAAIFVSKDLVVLIGVIVFTRIVSALPFFPAVKKALPLIHLPIFDKNLVRQLFGYGIWVTISDVITPLLTSADRFIIGAVSGATYVTYYTVPYNLANRVSILPAAVSSAIFPRMSMSSHENIISLNNQSLQILIAIMTPIFIIGIFFIKFFLIVWISAEFASNSAPVGIIILVGVWAKCLSFVPNNTLDARGKPDVLAKLNVVEFFLYIPFLWYFINFFGLFGAALSWTLLMFLNVVILFILTNISYRLILLQFLPSVIFVSTSALAALYVSASLILSLFLLVFLLVMSFFNSYYASSVVHFNSNLVFQRIKRIC